MGIGIQIHCDFAPRMDVVNEFAIAATKIKDSVTWGDPATEELGGQDPPDLVPVCGSADEAPVVYF